MGEPTEKPLEGGTMTPVSKYGKDVLRDAGPWTSTVQRLLQHLVDNGVTWCPVPKGRTDDGREILSYIKGRAPGDPMEDFVWSDETLATAATWLRELHDLTADYTDEKARWRTPTRQPAKVICHNDFGPDNIVFRNDKPEGVIDWDFAGPGPRMWDIAYLAYRLVPLTGPDNPASPKKTMDLGARIMLLLDSYGSDARVPEVLQMVVARLDHQASFTDGHATVKDNDDLRAEAAVLRADADYLRRMLRH